MAKFTIDLSDQAVSRLQVIVDKYNQDKGKSLTLQEWMVENLNDVAVNDEMVLEIEKIKQTESELFRQRVQEAANLKRDELVTKLETAGIV